MAGCWWCSQAFRRGEHRVALSTGHTRGEFVHRRCATDMERKGGEKWAFTSSAASVQPATVSEQQAAPSEGYQTHQEPSGRAPWAGKLWVAFALAAWLLYGLWR